MDYPHNPPTPKEQIQPRRPGPDNPYSPGFTIPGGKDNLTFNEYQSEILDHNPLITTCVNKFKWHVLSFTIMTGIGGRYFSKHLGFRKVTTFLTTATTSLFGLTLGVNMFPDLRCVPEELNAYNNARDLMLYGPWLRDKGQKEPVWKLKEMEMDPAKYIAKGLEPPSKL